MLTMDFEAYDNGVDDSICGFVGYKGKKRERLELGKAMRVVEYASKTVEQLNNSEEFQEQKQNTAEAPLDLHHSQIEIGNLLGQGTFSDVLEIKNSCVDFIDSERHVVKVLREKMVDDAGLFAACAAGLATEATILSLLNHKNIIRVKAWSHRGVCGYSTGKNDAFFIVLDRLDEMLSDRIIEWKHESDKLRFSLRQRHVKLDKFLNTRLEVARDLASAILYLHEHRIVHRDIKPANIGFQNGTLKLLDFDVSRILPKEMEEGQRFNLTAATGTRRYMSPECGLAEPYNEMTDVYSFAIVLDEMVSLEKAFVLLSKRVHELKVFRHGVRPPIHHSCPRHIRSMIQKAWARDIEARPSMKEIQGILEEELQAESRDVPSSGDRCWQKLRPFKMLKVLPPASIA